MDNTGVKTKKCSKCMATFECLHNKDCWCMDFNLSPETLDHLKKTYDDCLCPDCLRAFSL